MEPSSILARQKAFFQSGSTNPIEFRRSALRDLARMLETHDDELLGALHQDLGKSPQEAYASEISFLLGEIRHAIRHLPAWVKDQKRKSPMVAWPAKSSVRREALGVALIIGPWNYPLQLLLAPLIGAIAAGNCAVLKPSELAPNTATLLERLIRSTFPEDYITCIPGGVDTAKALLDQPFDKIFFTGGTQIGRAVMTAAARHLTPVTLELGGKCPCIVAEDAPLDLTARRIAWGKFLNAGQTCVAPDHLWVHKQIAPAFLESLKRAISDFYGPSPDKSPDFGRIINSTHIHRLNGYLAGGQVIHGGQSDPESRYFAPTILADPPLDSPVMTDEIFGPILPVLEYSEIDSVLDHIRQMPRPLAVYLFSGNANLQQKVLSGTKSGGVCFNDTILQILGPDLPCGGVGASGMGAYHGKAGFDAFSHPRSVLNRSLSFDPRFRYPPQKTPLATLKRILRYFG